MSSVITDGEFKELQKEFLKCVPETISTIENYVLSLEREKFNLSILRNMKGEIHSLKGSAGSYNMNILSTICHKFEDYISEGDEDIFWEDSNNIDTILSFIDLLRTCCRAYVFNDEEKFFNIKKKLNQLTKNAENTGKHILIVEGSKTIAIKLGYFCKERNFIVAYAKDGYEALGRLLHERFDYLITSVQVIPLDGISLIKTIKMIDSNSKNIKTILISSEDKIFNNIEDVIDYKLLKDGALLENLHKIFKNFDANMDEGKSISNHSENITDKIINNRPLRNILYVDDDKHMTVLIRNILSKIDNLNSKFCHNKDEVFKALQSDIPDLIILDVYMPDISGIELAKMIKSNEKLNNIPIIFLTAYTSKKELEKLNEVKHVGILQKPINPKLIYKEIERIWNISQNV